MSPLRPASTALVKTVRWGFQSEQALQNSFMGDANTTALAITHLHNDRSGSAERIFGLASHGHKERHYPSRYIDNLCHLWP